MTIGPEPICTACKRFRTDALKGPVCSAFPDGIPDRIKHGGFDHRLPFPEDGGQRFVRDPDKPMPSGFAEDRDTQEPVFIADPGTIRHQTRKELKATAKRLIADLRDRTS